MKYSKHKVNKMVHNIRENSPSTTDSSHCMAYGLFGDLDGIDDARDVQAREQTTLDKLIEVGNQMVAKYSQVINNHTIKDYLKYMAMYIELTQERLSEAQFNEEDLKNFIFYCVNHDYESSKAQAYGMYSGCLLQLLTERNKEQGKSTQFYIDGKGNRFDYLFCYANHVDEVRIVNFSGDYICSFMGSFGGSANLIYGENLTGNFIFSNIGSYNSNINRIFGSHIKGNWAFSRIGTNGCNINEVIGESIEGRGAFSAIGDHDYESENVCAVTKINRLIGINIKGDNAFTILGKNRSLITQLVLVGIEGNNLFLNDTSRTYPLVLNQLVAVGIKGNNAFRNIHKDVNIDQLIGVKVVGNNSFFNENIGQAIIRQAIINGIEGDYTFSTETTGCAHNIDLLVGVNLHGNYAFSNHSFSSRNFLLFNCRGDGLFSNSDLSNSDVLYYNVYPPPSKTKNPYKSLHHIKDSVRINRRGIKILRKAHFDEILTLAKSLEGKSYQEVLDIGEQLYALHPEPESMIHLQLMR